MKKTLIAMMAILFSVIGILAAASHPFASQAEFLTEESYIMQGTIQEVNGTEILITNEDHQLIAVDTNEHTALLTNSLLGTGDVIRVTYDGLMSRSIPSRIYAQSISSYQMHGTVTSAYEGGFTITCDDGSTRSVTWNRQLTAGTEVTVWYNQSSDTEPIEAWHVRGTTLTGTITGVNGDGSFILDTGTEECIIRVTDSTTLPIMKVEVGERISVAIDDPAVLSLPASYQALEVFLAP